jgi:hypothetical protein
VGEDDGVELFFERKNFLGQRLKFFLRHRAARLNFSDIGHGERLLSQTVGVNEAKFLIVP